MLRSLHMKLVMIMVLLILSLMMVVGAFLINSVTAFYLEDFYSQMSDVFQNPKLYHDLTTPAQEEEDGAEQLSQVLNAYVGELGVDNRNRKLYILDGSGVCRVSPDGEAAQLNYTENLTFALTTGLETNQTGDQSNLTLDYMDVAIPIHRGGEEYVIYILDNKATSNDLTNQMLILIIEALVFGLVISILLSFLLSKTMVTPIQRLTEGAMRVAERDFSRKIEVLSQDEIGVLTDTFNDMAGQLQDTLRQVENERNKL
ncbi:MAG: cell wall metabolism sensor histidine kinase WalK, partial [Lawsonibacter sp.]|nr:cell wall metabolism sensor histidine kinase WalK [Lawsonibacter sp.]